jgi:GGDEF domain-containing protein
LLTNSAADQIENLIKRFEVALSSRSASTGFPYSIDFSYGLVAYEPLKHESVEDMLQEADRAMYEDKKLKRQARQTPSSDS